jgi:hypothetical protein
MVRGDVPELGGNFLEWMFSMICGSFIRSAANDLQIMPRYKSRASSICGKIHLPALGTYAL